MIRFDLSLEINGDVKISRLYAIYGNDEHGTRKLLIVGHPFNAGQYIFPVIDLTCPLQPCKFYREQDCAADVCEAFGVNPQTARYLNDYDSFSLIFRHDEKED